MPKSTKPRYLLHKATGQARVRINGKKDVYLGKFGSPESREKYEQVIADWFASNGDPSQNNLTIDDLAILFFAFAENYYRRENGEPTGEVNNLRYSLRPLIRLFGNTRIRDFGPIKLKAVREELVKAGHCRTHINSQINRIRRVFRWGVENEHVPSPVYQALAAVAGLKAGRSKAIEAARVLPVPEETVNATIPHLPVVVADMVRLQMLTGCRPGELCLLRPCDVTMQSNRVWVYRPASHKTQHHGKERRIFIGPQGQDVLRMYLERDAEAYCFSPREAEAQRSAEKRANRKTPITPSQAARRPKRNQRRRPGQRYGKNSYTRAIIRGCELAFGMPDELRKRIPPDVPDDERAERKRLASEWRSKHCFSPNQIRHSRATAIRERYGLEAAATVLGHSDPRVTEIYAERDFELAARIMREVG
ncbi:MAG: site-specific integrase [Planctomycetaceae bacterium]|nr:site-specific integrase [Planctomycetaceae bacterium]